MINVQQLQKAFSEEEAICLPMISIKNQDVVIDGGVILEDYEFVQFVEGTAYYGYNWIKGRNTNQIFQISNQNKYISGKVIRSNSGYSYGENMDKLVADINITVDIEVIGDGDISIDELEIKFADYILNQTQQAIDIYYETKSDYFGICRDIKMTNANLYNKYQNIDEINCNVKVNIEY